MRKLFEIGQDVDFRIYSDEIRVSDHHNKLNDEQLQVIAKMFWGDDVRTEVVRTTETITSEHNGSKEVRTVEHILIKKIE